MNGTFVINGKKRELNFTDETILLDLLRSTKHTEVHCGCSESSCVCCTVLLNGRPVSSCDVDGPYRAKSAAEIGINGTAPAIANAIYDAVGVRLYDLPFTPEKVLVALKRHKRVIL